jgi:hypothetical protein
MAIDEGVEGCMSSLLQMSLNCAQCFYDVLHSALGSVLALNSGSYFIQAIHFVWLGGS